MFCERNTFFLMMPDLALVTIGWTFWTGGEAETTGSRDRYGMVISAGRGSGEGEGKGLTVN